MRGHGCPVTMSHHIQKIIELKGENKYRESWYKNRATKKSENSREKLAENSRENSRKNSRKNSLNSLSLRSFMSDSFTDSVESSNESLNKNLNEKEYEKELKQIELDDEEKFNMKEFNIWMREEVEKLREKWKRVMIRISLNNRLRSNFGGVLIQIWYKVMFNYNV